MSISFSRKTAERVDKTDAAARQAFSIESVGRNCFMIHDRPAEYILKITWRSVIQDKVSFGLSDALMLLFGHFSVTLKSKYTLFDTYHPISRLGRSSLRWIRFKSLTLAVCAFLLTLLGIVLFFIGCLSALLQLSPSTSAESNVSTVVFFVVSAILFILGIFGQRYFTKLGLPGALKAIGVWPIQLYRIKKLPFPANTSDHHEMA